jgi:CDP-glucose 4,6-dehydratase
MAYREIFEKHYKGKKVFLTGHTGFKGSWMLAWLHHLGAVVKGYALEPQTGNSIYDFIGGDSLCHSTIADIRDKDNLIKSVLEFEPDIIFHFAAQPLVRLSYELPLYTYEVNVNGTAHILEAVRQMQNPCSVVIITTDKVYENREISYAYKETDKLGGYDPYSSSKAAAEILVGSYRNSFFNIDQWHKHRKGIATARAGNVIGGGDWALDRIFPDIVRALQENEVVTVRNPRAIRPWQHVLEPLSGYLLLGLKLAGAPQRYAESWNLGPRNDDVLNVEQLVVQAIRSWGTGDYNILKATGQPHEALLLQLDITKAGSLLKWEPKFDAAASIENTVIEYKEMLSGNRNIFKQQIIKYSSI